MTNDTRDHLHRAFRTLFHSGLSMSHALEEVARDVDHCPEVTHLLEFIRQAI